MARLKPERTPISPTTSFLWIVVVFLVIWIAANLCLR
jgi:hypothetical protein